MEVFSIMGLPASCRSAEGAHDLSAGSQNKCRSSTGWADLNTVAGCGSVN